MRPVSGGNVSASGANERQQQRRGGSDEPRLPRIGRYVERWPASMSRPWVASAGAQNFTGGGVCAVSLAANSAIGLLARKNVEAQSMPGNVFSSVL